MTEFWKIWKYALGSFQDETTKQYDDIICVIRTFIFIQLVITNCFIIVTSGYLHPLLLIMNNYGLEIAFWVILGLYLVYLWEEKK